MPKAIFLMYNHMVRGKISETITSKPLLYKMKFSNHQDLIIRSVALNTCMEVSIMFLKCNLITMQVWI